MSARPSEVRPAGVLPWVLILGALAVIGLAGHVAVLAAGQRLFGSTDGVPWNILVSAYAYLAGAAAGLFFWASLGDTWRLAWFRPVSTLANLAALAALVPALAAIGSDLGRPERLYGLLLSPNLRSPLWWMAMTYGALLVVMLVKFWAITRQRPRVARGASLVGLVLALAAPATLGTLFGVLLARPLWHSPITPVYFLVLALAIGAAAVLALALLTGAREAAVRFRPILAALLVLVAFILLVKLALADADYARLLVNGPYAWAFWGLQVQVGVMVPLLLLIVPGANRLMEGLAVVFTLVGAFAARIVDVLAGQGRPVLPMLKYEPYRVTLTEVAMVAGALSLAVILYLIGSEVLAASGRGMASLAPGDD